MIPVLRIDHVECIIVKRINRFIVEAVFGEEPIYVHLNNTGRLLEYIVEGRIGYCTRINGRKLRYRLSAIKENDYAALIDTYLQEKTFEKLISLKLIPWLRKCFIHKRNPRLDHEVIDYMVKCNSKEIFVEVKSAVFRFNRVYAAYPDCPTLRGRRQILKLIENVRRGGSSIIVFIAGLPNVKGFKPYIKGDPEIARLLRIARNEGVALKAINIFYDPISKYIVLNNPDLPVIL